MGLMTGMIFVTKTTWYVAHGISSFCSTTIVISTVPCALDIWLGEHGQLPPLKDKAHGRSMTKYFAILIWALSEWSLMKRCGSRLQSFALHQYLLLHVLNEQPLTQIRIFYWEPRENLRDLVP